MKKIKKKNLVINGAISLGVVVAGVIAALPKSAEAVLNSSIKKLKL